MSSSRHHDTLPDPEQGTLDIVLPSDLPPRHIAIPSETKVPQAQSSSASDLGVALSAVSSQVTLVNALPILLNGDRQPFTPIDMEGAQVPAPDTPRPLASSPSNEKAMNIYDEKAATTTATEKPTAATPKPKPTGKPAPKWKRASRWIRFQIWFNTYRFVFHKLIT
jgi:septal ring-binding cell division protein DamX